MKKEEFDDLFDRAFDDSVKSHNFVPDSEASWAKMQQLLQKRTRRRRQLRMLPYVAASFLLGALIFGTPTATEAFKPFYQAYVTVKDGITRIVFGSMPKSDTVPLTAPPPDHGEGSSNPAPSTGGGSLPESSVMKTYSPGEQLDLSFEPPEVTYIPDGFTLREISTYRNPQDPLPSDLYHSYANKDGQLIGITFMLLRPGQITSTGDAVGVNVEALSIQGNEAYLFAAGDGWASLEYIRGNMFIKITGPLSKTDIVRIAEELKFKT